MRIFLTILTIFFFSLAALAQQPRTINNEEDKEGILMESELSFGVRLYSHGWGIFGEKAKILNIKKVRVFQFGFASYRDFRQKKQPAVVNYVGPGLDNPRDFFFGKQNDFFMLRVGYGYKRVLANKADKNGVRLTFTYIGGLSLGFLKPYYLELAYPNPNDNDSFIIQSEKYSEDNADRFTDIYSIVGASSYGKGFKEIEPVPGGFVKIGLNFDWATNEQLVKALEAGFILDVYYKKIELMVTEDNKPFFLGAYIGFQFGKRW